MIEDVGLEAGDACIFPAKRVWHRVTKTRSGLRRTVVFWTSTPKAGV
jgi:predicted 2-oxoglutarate/Fe(II)-dependent dioxygenase YbiX